ncbi:hypothetical protein [Streptomyces sp. NPDC002054]|uniref:hypothetical protein n=1 Tax=Streptomyces sp. NPDC002054 TaxID=3154663 RepID=UPI00332823EA
MSRMLECVVGAGSAAPGAGPAPVRETFDRAVAELVRRGWTVRNRGEGTPDRPAGSTAYVQLDKAGWSLHAVYYDAPDEPDVPAVSLNATDGACLKAIGGESGEPES